MKAFFKFLGTSALALGLSAGISTAATLQIDGNGQLLGATNVAVGGTFYDVAFVDGTCNAVVFGCSGSPGLIFKDAATALLAGAALLNDVLLNTAQGDFDSVPSLVNGIDENVGVSFIYTAFDNGAGFDVVTTLNHQATGLDSITGPFAFNPSIDTSLEPNTTWASWSLAGAPVAPVPLPAGLPLMFLGLASFGFLHRRTRSV